MQSSNKTGKTSASYRHINLLINLVTTRRTGTCFFGQKLKFRANRDMKWLVLI